MKPLISVFSTLCLLAVTVIYANSQPLTFKRQPKTEKLEPRDYHSNRKRLRCGSVGKKRLHRMP